ncbi:MAG: hypothetical protein KC635_11220, partial [Myxococcales bacterium]|nr:hypothetical protein [Myxococcales bacterium]
INPGNSGGPVLDKEGRVIAIVTAYIEGANNVNFAIRVDAAFKHLKSLAEACDDCLVVRTRVDAPVFVDDALVGKGPRVLLVVTPGHHHVRTQIGSREEAKDVDFPADRDVDFATGVGDATVGASRSERAEQVSVLELPRDLTECEKILPYWIGRSVTVTLADGTSVTGELIEARGIERLGLALPNGERRRIALYDVQRVKRDR